MPQADTVPIVTASDTWPSVDDTFPSLSWGDPAQLSSGKSVAEMEFVDRDISMPGRKNPSLDPVDLHDGSVPPPKRNISIVTKAPCSLDFSALEDPNPLAVPDPSWDTNRVLFNEYREEKKRADDDAPNLFGDFNVNTLNSHSVAPRSSDPGDDPVAIKLGELGTGREIIGLDVLGWPDDPLLAGGEEIDTDREPNQDEDHDDDDNQNLLLNVEDDGDIPMQSQARKDDRLRIYSTTKDDESSTSENSDHAEIESEEEQVEEVIDYVRQVEDDDADLADDEVALPDFTNAVRADQFIVYDIPDLPSVPTDEQDIAPVHSVGAANDSEQILPVKNQLAGDPPANNQHESGVESDLAGNIHSLVVSYALPPPPPPPNPPPPKKKRSKRSSRSKPVPLLSPPPPEKMKKWQEDKARAKNHLNVMKARRDPSQQKIMEDSATQGDWQSFDLRQDFPDEEGQSSRRDAEVNTGDAATEKQTIQKDHVLQLAILSESPSFSRSGNRSPKVASPEKYKCAASASIVIHDQKMAEKIDLAMSTASWKFEENTLRSQPDELSPQDVSGGQGGAFSSWNLEQSLIVDNEEPPVESGAHDVYDHVIYGTTTITALESLSSKIQSPRYVFPVDEYPSPFELTITRAPIVIAKILAFLGNPVEVSRMKMLSKDCMSFINKNEYLLYRDAVRVGGMSMHVRPYFWLWVTLERCKPEINPLHGGLKISDLVDLETKGKLGKWQSVIERDVSRAFGNLPPHKTGARLRTDSIVRALVSWGRCRTMKRGVKGGGDSAPPQSLKDPSFESDEASLTPTDTVSDWGGVAPAGSFTAVEVDDSTRSTGESNQPRIDDARTSDSKDGESADREMALGGNAMTELVKKELQKKLSWILHILAASNEDIGYCQGMDYVVAHLLRILQETIRWKGAHGTLPRAITSAPLDKVEKPLSQESLLHHLREVDKTIAVEETCFRVMQCFFDTYNLRHFYYPELRCLKTCCRVFEKLIKLKLPVLADHFEHHELNVGLFALGWFQTLFLYLPSMPSATVCHIWDIWLVERSFKIFFRVGTAILFLSQPILLNHELEGMMSYLNTFPDATLLSPDILIACALQIKVTNQLLMEIEREVMACTF